jgi:hypothetical protein
MPMSVREDMRRQEKQSFWGVSGGGEEGITDIEILEKLQARCRDVTADVTRNRAPKFVLSTEPFWVSV